MFGILNIHKPRGPTSRDCVNQLQRLIHPNKIGHGGTLDPIASGVLLLLVGPAVRLTEEIHELNKEYVGKFQLGVTSPSADSESELTYLSNASFPTREEMAQVLSEFHGSIRQVPPVYSAVRINGRRAYDLARAGINVDTRERVVHVETIEIVAYEFPFFTLRIVCSTGTYIRSIGRDIARRLGTDAIMIALERTRIGNFSLDKSLDLESFRNVEDVYHALKPPLDALVNWPTLQLSAEILRKFKDGQRVQLDVSPGQAETRIAVVDETGKLHSIATQDLSSGLWKASKYFPSS